MIECAAFDLETSDLNANFGIVLCGVVRPARGERVIIRSDETNPGWKKGKRSDDRETVKQIVEELSKYDILVAHNGARFDLPYLRTRMAYWRLGKLPDFKLVDPLQLAWRKLRMKRNSLASLSEFFSTKAEKTPLLGRTWASAVLDGNRAAMDEIVEHCVADVDVLVEVLEVVKPYCKVFDDRGSAL